MIRVKLYKQIINTVWLELIAATISATVILAYSIKTVMTKSSTSEQKISQKKDRLSDLLIILLGQKT